MEFNNTNDVTIEALANNDTIIEVSSNNDLAINVELNTTKLIVETALVYTGRTGPSGPVGPKGDGYEITDNDYDVIADKAVTFIKNIIIDCNEEQDE